jgi:MFS family permease
MFVYALAANVALFTVIMFTRSFISMIVSMFLLGFFNSAKFGVGWPYLLELVPLSSRSNHAAAFGSVGAIWGIVGALFFIFVCANAYVFCAIGYVFQIMTLFLTLLLPESPVYLFFQGRIEEGKESLERLAKLNGKHLDFNYAEFKQFEGRLSLPSSRSMRSYHSHASALSGGVILSN